MIVYLHIPTGGFAVGDNIRVRSESNKIRRNIKEIISETQIELNTFIRPSRGFAKHIRRIKNATK